MIRIVAFDYALDCHISSCHIVYAHASYKIIVESISQRDGGDDGVLHGYL
jgi:hypothetical protein